jgi:hypothetical protein
MSAKPNPIRIQLTDPDQSDPSRFCTWCFATGAFVDWYAPESPLILAEMGALIGAKVKGPAFETVPGYAAPFAPGGWPVVCQDCVLRSVDDIYDIVGSVHDHGRLPNSVRGGARVR